MGVIVREKKKGSGEWWIFINHRGERMSRKAGRDKRKAIEAAKELEARLRLGDLGVLQGKNKVHTFGRYADIWKNTVLPATCKRSTAKDYEGILKNHVLPKFGKDAVTEITRAKVRKFLLSKTTEGYSASTVTHIKNVLSGPLLMAMDEEVITANPAHGLGKLFKAQDRKLKIDPLTRDETKILLDSFQRHYPRHHPMALTLARTGLRLGEALGLQWGDIDFNGRFLLVRRNISRGRIETSKNGKIRRVDMSKQLTHELRALKHERKKEALKKAWGKMPKWLFVDAEGTRIVDKSFQRAFSAALDKAELRKVRVHDLRHGFASALIQAGESPAYVMEQLGHHSIKMTVDIYGHLVPGANKSAVDRLDDTRKSAPYPHPKTKKDLTNIG